MTYQQKPLIMLVLINLLEPLNIVTDKVTLLYDVYIYVHICTHTHTHLAYISLSCSLLHIRCFNAFKCF